jgi:ribose 1,5-bisphosphokinase
VTPQVRETGAMTEGRLFYVVGASGVAKDGLLDYARRQLSNTHPIMFAHRYITRPAVTGSENEISLSEGEFALRKHHGLFVMDWESRGLRYGIGNEVNYWLAMGLSVVVKGSRAYLGEALRAYPDMTVIWVVAAPETMTLRAARRPSDPGCAPPHEHTVAGRSRERRIVHISNNRSLTPAGEKLVSVLVGDPAELARHKRE